MEGVVREMERNLVCKRGLVQNILPRRKAGSHTELGEGGRGVMRTNEVKTPPVSLHVHVTGSAAGCGAGGRLLRLPT